MKGKYILIFVLIFSSKLMAQVEPSIDPSIDPGQSCQGCHQYWMDNDHDYYGVQPIIWRLSGQQPSNYILYNDQEHDCNDANPSITVITYYMDSDGDGFGDPLYFDTSFCSNPPDNSWVLNDLDCNDQDNTANPDTIWYADNDNDGFGGVTIAQQCDQPSTGGVNNHSDCDDNDSTVGEAKRWYTDSDGDGFGDPSSTPILSCLSSVPNRVANNLDSCPSVSGSILGCVVPINANFSPDDNYIVTIMPKIEVNDIQQINDSNDVSIHVTYYDGLGRPIQQIAHKQSALGKDIITPIEYDAFGRQSKEYLPIIDGQSLLYRSIDSSAVNSYYSSVPFTSMESTTVPFSEKQFELSPLNRVLKQAAPGTPWAMGSGHEVKFDYQTNEEGEVRLFRVSLQEDYTPSLIDNDQHYPVQSLYKTITKDENWVTGDHDNHTAQEFKDLQGRVVLKRIFGVSMINQGGTNEAPNLVAVNEAHDTYYVYDDYGNLTYVIPPIVDLSQGISSVLDDLCYQYQYDYRNRLIAKKLPGKQWEYIVYNKSDKPVATGPVANPWGVADSWGWLITKYDAFGRVVYTGWMESNGINKSNRDTFEGELGTDWAETFSTTPSIIVGVAVSYTNTTYPTDFKLLTVNYYDRYDYEDGPILPNEVLGAAVSTNVKGLATGSWVRVLETPSSSKAEIAYTLYDEKGRAIENHKTNRFGGYTIVDTKLDFTGKPEYTNTLHKRTPNQYDHDIKVTDTYQYTPQGRLLYHKQKINDGPEQLIAKNEYDDLGQLKTKQVGGADVTTFVGLQKVDYSYNIRGWLKGINDLGTLQEAVTGVPKDLFAFKINYNEVADTIGGDVKALYNGNISETFWQTSSDNIVRKYGYAYDNLNRLNKAIYQKPNTTYPVTHMYDEEMNYDKNGNIQHLNRFGDLDDPSATNAVPMDDLTYVYDEYNKNRLLKVTDASGHPKGFLDDTDGIEPDTENDYKYDDNGNLTSDQNKKIERIFYNHLNLPTQINFVGGNFITYLYNAVGQKVMKQVKVVGTDESEMRTDYLDGYQYSNGVLKFFPHAEGYVNVTQVTGLDSQQYNKFNYVYNYTDHLGNVRVSYGYDGPTQQLKILEQNHYYPFGLKHTRYNVEKKKYDVILDDNGDPIVGIIPDNTPVGVGNGRYKYKYNGKEYQDELGLNMYDYGAMLYDPALGRRNNIDPKAEVSRRWSPYSYCYNNPMYFVDPDGMQADGWIRQLEDGKATMTYNPTVNTVDEAIAKGYKNVDTVGATGSVAAKDGSYSLALNVDGTVTDQNSGQAVTMGQPSSTGFGGEITTPAGTTIQSSSIGYNPSPLATGACDTADGLSPAFLFAGMLEGAASLTSSASSGRVFWSGGNVAKDAAAEFAGANGMKTLEMTPAGSVMNAVSPYLPNSITSPIWSNLSSNFAKGAVGEANFFTTVAGPRATSIWSTIEQPILQSNGVKIITNTIK